MTSAAKYDLDDTELIADLDKSNMRFFLRSQASSSFESYCKVRNEQIYIGKISSIVAAGMGGSGMPITALNFLFKDEFKIPFVVSQTYELPYFADSNTLLMAISDSGETEEVISQFQQAKEKNSKIIAIGQGNRLIEMAKKDNYPFYTYLSTAPSRASFAYMFGSALAYLENIDVIAGDRKESLMESIKVVDDLDKEIGIEIPTRDNIAKRTAISLLNHIPVIYIESPFDSLGSRFAKMQNENAASFAFYNHLPEFRHNEIMPWVSKSIPDSMFVPVLIRDNAEYSHMEREIDEIKKVLDTNCRTIQFRAKGCEKLARFFYLQYLLDMISFYLGILCGKDPSITPALRQLKRKLRQEALIPCSRRLTSF
jgi:glucose/mannose-6-phosphate isomerase